MSVQRTRRLARRSFVLMAISLSSGRLPVARAQTNDVDDAPSTERFADKDPHKRYFLIGATTAERAPESGFRLLVVLPGGDGGEDFQPFVRRIFSKALPDGYLVAQLVAVKWTEDQRIVWPTKKLSVEQQEFTTEEFIESVIRDVKEHCRIDAERVYTLSWSSSGPAAYATALQEKTGVCGSFIAMSVFRPGALPDLKIAKGRSFCIYHSPADRVCPFRMAEQARDALKEAGASVRFQRYDGGHGWRGDVCADIRKGIEWLESMPRKKSSDKAEARPDAGKKETTSKPARDGKVDQAPAGAALRLTPAAARGISRAVARWTQIEIEMMRRALALAAKGEGCVEPNPMVGCVVVRSGRVVGEGYHRKFGGPHAEVHALRAARGAARGATVYVTLEPCAHQGKTPPCVDALIEAKIQRCVVATRDPNPIVAGRGLKALRRAGIQVATGLLAEDARQLIAPFAMFHEGGRPFVTLKWAQSIDGKIATRSGDSMWITSKESRRRAHALRARVDAIIVGVGTVLADDPELTARDAKVRRVATRIVLDREFRTPVSSKLVRSAADVPTIIVGSGKRVQWRRPEAALERAGVETLLLPEVDGGIDLAMLLRMLRERRMTNVMVEGGGRVLGSFIDRRLADAAEIYVAPRLIGGAGAPGPLAGSGPENMDGLIDLSSVRHADCGPDICYNLRFGS
ncbi:MAG TPA: bifunctional diaminohydroxyphosphoribosylaminopyrimidine deaminase/5-amino-6-(5-phosphoribosylamino)uracil reductase RibD [Phycisphaerae bacterium]|nr:bifunctional diaminohydroxyphosphoribosylaminopyrimidine deaminase/5-amino-6-(5-phosphoribosylamino)uracil reductase RibD [Phycisphaerae bacterium]HRW53751.1 bifunctional diaminohydroxyphosphoribosylaminopyrimidine deaminase/5-amino-6-(5-phosphoribosylamino)uracil reductase RibD [Phycisphaerae bacterium]